MTSTLAADIEVMRGAMNEAASAIFPDLLTLIVPGASAPDGFGGTTEGDPVTHANIPGKVEPLGRSDRLIGGAQITNQTHRITMGATATTRAVKPHYQIKRQAQGIQAEELYENPVALMGSMDLFMKIAATLKS